jgi:hypothetical protein
MNSNQVHEITEISNYGAFTIIAGKARPNQSQKSKL